MTADAFALLGFPRRPWLEAGEARERFIRASAEVHPDRVHGAEAAARAAAQAAYTALNAAQRTLAAPRLRAEHLLELETGAKPVGIQRVPADVMTLFTDLAALLHEADQHQARLAAATSPLVRAGLFGAGLALAARVQAALAEVQAAATAAEAALKDLNPAWAAADGLTGAARRAALPLAALAEPWRRLVFLDRWSGQLRGRLTNLALG
jgi:DnaJ-domain-containing protein 1